jgi:arginine-tRNA-protein transferase
MFDSGFSFINEEFYASVVAPQQLDALLADGWRHFGTHFFRYNLGFYEREIRLVIPLRVDLTSFAFSKSQRRIVGKNQDLRTVVRPIEITAEKESLFERHKQRFKEGVPDSLTIFLSRTRRAFRAKQRKFAFTTMKNCSPRVFSMSAKERFPAFTRCSSRRKTRRSLGIYTMLLEIEYALANGRNFIIKATLTKEIRFTIIKNALAVWRDTIGAEIGKRYAEKESDCR